jgi:predicted unusual protein kinase regulating ubiquinone biosynthesis (AarF/ABC1/UbiB family)
MSENSQGLILKTDLNNRLASADANGHAENGLVKIKDVSGANGNGKLQLASNAKVAIPRADAKAFAALEAAENSSAKTYQGWRGWWRLLLVGSVVARLALYLYLDRYDIAYKYYRMHVANRFERARQINWFAVLGEYLLEIYRWTFDKTIRLVRWFVFRGEANKEARQEKQAIWLKRTIIKLGPTFIKIGQALGTRADLLPLSYVKELGTLQDDVPAFSNEIAFARIEKELGKPIGDLYADFDVDPIAAASLGQVYRAHLFSGEEVAVKVQRPNLAATIRGDIDIMAKIAKFAERFPALNENADWAGMLREFDETIHEEMDYSAEAGNADRFRENFKDWLAVHVPKIYWSHTTGRVLTMEFIRGTKVTATNDLKTQGISPAKVNRLLIRTYLKQLLEDGFFHADPHPGNLLVMKDGRVAFFDFGMVGRITPRLQSKMVDAFFHVVSKDPQGIAQDLIELDFMKPGADPEKVRPVVEKMFEIHLDLKLKDVKFKEMTYELADIMYDYPFRLPSNFTYIMRALMTLEGIGYVIDPEFNFFETARPFAKEFMLKREGKHFRQMIFDKITGRDEGKIDWQKTWKLTKMAVKAYLQK